MRTPSDAELVERFQAGDREAFAALVERYIRLAGAIGFQVLGDYDRAADAAQDAFLKAHAALHGLRAPERFRSWFSGVVRSVAIDRLRRRRRAGGQLSDLAEERLSVRSDPTAGLEDEERREAVRGAIAELSERYREVVALKYLEGWSYQEIADHLGESVEAVESRLHRARAQLRGKLRGFARRSGLG